MEDIIETEEILTKSEEELELSGEDFIDDVVETTDERPIREPLGKRARKRKEEEIDEALACDPPDLDALRELATSKGGLLNDQIRRRVWPIFLNMDPYEVSPKPTQTEINSHREYVQVDLDVQRSLRRFPPDIPKDRRLALQGQLTNLIVRILIKHKDLNYYQGYHDVCVTFLLVLGEELAFALLEKLSTTRFRDFMEPTMKQTVKFVNYVGTLIRRFSPDLYTHLERSEVTPIFCLSWLITWFGHVLNDYRRIVRLYDFFLATHELMPVYLATCIILHRQDGALELEPEMPILHNFLSNVPDELPFESLVPEAAQLMIRYPPEQLVKDAEKDAIRGTGFYHQWIDMNKPRRGFLWNVLTSLSSVVIPSFVHRHWFATISVILPVVVAVGWYSLYANKNHPFLNNNFS